MSRWFWLLSDQAIYALSNFVIGILFARWMSPADYGLYTVSFAGFLLLSLLHWAAVVEPLLVQSSQVGPDSHRPFIKTALLAHGGLNAGLCLLSSIGCLIAIRSDSPALGWAILAAGCGGAWMLGLLAARRLCLVFLTARVSACAGLGYFIGLAASAYGLHALNAVSWLALWALSGLWSLLITGLICWLLLHITTGQQAYHMLTLWKFQWRYARWGIAAAIGSWTRTSGIMLILSHYAGLVEVASLGAILSIASPMLQINSALNAHWLVDFSRRQSNPPWLIAGLYATGLAGVLTVAEWVAPLLIHTLYHGLYDAAAWQLPLALSVFGLLGLESLFASKAKATGKLLRGYLPQTFGATVAITGSVLLIPSYGAIGALLIMLASAFSGSLTAIMTTWWGSYGHYILRLRGPASPPRSIG